MTRALPLLLLALAACRPPLSAEAPPVAAPAPAPPPDTPVASAGGNGAAAVTPRNFPPSADCQMHGAGDWTAHIDAMPGPNGQRLIVTGTIGVKPAARAELRLDPAVLESNPPQRIVNLIIRLPTEPTIDMLTRREVRGEWRVTPPLGAVHIRCGGLRVASIGDLEVAH